MKPSQRCRCGRKAISFVKGKAAVRKHHPLCERCHRAEVDRARAARQGPSLGQQRVGPFPAFQALLALHGKAA